MSVPRARIVVMAHNEERRIATCLSSLPLGTAGIEAHVIVNGSTDRTAEIARRFPGAQVHEYSQGGKARSWNRFVLDEAGPAEAFVFVDGDAEIVEGSVEALLTMLSEHPQANAASGMPCNGRGVEAYRQEILDEHGMFGDLYALRGSFVERMRESGIRLPEDLIGDDSLIGAMAKTDLRNEDHWDEARVQPCEGAGFLCEPTQITLGSLAGQYKRMINYSVRHYQNRIVSEIMRGPGPVGLPPSLASHYARWLPRFSKRRNPVLWWIDRQALRRMAAKA
ncbi:MAG: glycosyltransferase family A protein [Pseudomonadota bacterium]